jgi:hypothetical protein
LGQILGSLLDDYGRSYRMVISATLWFLFLHFLLGGGGGGGGGGHCLQKFIIDFDMIVSSYTYGKKVESITRLSIALHKAHSFMISLDVFSIEQEGADGAKLNYTRFSHCKGCLFISAG